MMKTVTGNLVSMVKQGQFDIIIHGANIHNTMGSGIAAEIRRELPEMYEADLATRMSDIRKLGHFSVAQLVKYETQTGNPFIDRPFGINLYTQATMGGPGVHIDYEAFARGMYAINMMFAAYPVQPKFGIPKIGAGLGGGDWDRIVDIVKSIGFADITYVEFDN
jgi:O-acetyl-ADP-ribose deacetylase (regulator of RNase III)